MINTVRDLALDHNRLSSMSTSYVENFVIAIARMEIDDEEVWASLAAYLEERCETCSKRNLWTQL